MSTTLTNSVENINVKLQFNDEFRRFFVPPHIQFSDLESKIKSLLGLSSEPISIKYKDEEGEWITISSDDELETGLNISGNHRLFRLLCTIKGDNNPIVNNGEVDEMKGGDNVPEAKWKKYRDGPKKWKKNDERREKNFQGKRGKKFQEKRFEETEAPNETPVEKTSEIVPEKGGDVETETPNETPNDLENEGVKKRRKGEKKEKGEKKKRGKNEVADEEGSSSESNSDIALLTLEEIKLEVTKLREEEKILKEKVRVAKDSWKAVKDVVNEKRKDEKVLPGEILVLREEVTNKKNEKEKVQVQLRNTRNRMDKLREAAKTKQV